MRGLPKLLVSTVLIVGLLVVGAGVAGWLYRTRPAPERTAAGPPPPLVVVQHLQPRDVRETFVGYGTARPDREVTLQAEVGGVVVEVAEGLKDGSAIVEGQLLVAIDERSYRQQLARVQGLAADALAQLARLDVERQNLQKLIAIAEQEVQVNRDELKRLTDLFEEERASTKEVDFARLAYQRARREVQGLENELSLIEPRRQALQASVDARSAEAELARLDIEKCRLTAPFSGQVDHLLVEEGELVQRGVSIARLVNLDRIEVPIELPASVRPRVSLQTPCELSIDSMPDHYWTGSVRRIAPVVDSRNRTFAVYVEVDNRAQEVALVPGDFVKARVTGPLLEQVLLIPRGAIVQDYVFVVNRNLAHVRRVTVERLIDEQAVVSGQLSAGDRVIVTNLDVLYDGAIVRVGVPGRGVGSAVGPAFQPVSSDTPRSDRLESRSHTMDPEPGP